MRGPPSGWTCAKRPPAAAGRSASSFAPVLPGVTSAALLVGTPGPAQKLTVQLRRGGQVVGYLKYAEKLAARDRLAREHQVLSVLPLGVGPEVLKFGAFGEGTALVTAAVPGKALPARLPASADVEGLLSRLARPEQRAIDAFPCVQEMRAYAPELVEPWVQALGGSPWPLVYHHGDCTPWNLLRDADGELRAIDWEYGTAEGLPYLDAVYFTLQVASLIYRWPASRAKASALETLGALPPAQAEAFVNLTALYAHLQASRDGHAPDTPLQRWRRDVWDTVWEGSA